MADARYSKWIHTQPCAVCGSALQVEGHHALYGTTYDPDAPRPAKAIPDARKGMGQKSHDVFLIPLCLKHHVPGIHKLGNYFDGWSREEANAWEEKQVREHRNRYAMQEPEPVAHATKPRRSVTTTQDAVIRERERIARVIRARAAERHHLPAQYQLLSELADDVAAGLDDTGSF